MVVLPVLSAARASTVLVDRPQTPHALLVLMV
jgi:hypothetical protein